MVNENYGTRYFRDGFSTKTSMGGRSEVGRDGGGGGWHVDIPLMIFKQQEENTNISRKQYYTNNGQYNQEKPPRRRKMDMYFGQYDLQTRNKESDISRRWILLIFSSARERFVQSIESTTTAVPSLHCVTLLADSEPL